GNAYAPFPEEMNRRLTDQLSSLHFAPTARARENLLSEGIPPESIVVTGNTAIDAIQWVIRRYGLAIGAPSDAEETTILVTAHRRESFGPPLRDICQAIRLVAQLNVTVVFPVHPNPQVRHTVLDELAGHDNIHLTDPLDYLSFVRLMLRSRLILTDSGGIQEEATALGRPVLVLRNETDRPEAVEAGQAKLVGTDPERILAVTQILLQDQVEYERMSHRSEVYGDGRAAKRIWRTVDGYIAHAE
ncbi:MAG: non-hydrolyzing UDP-N-acetylglucosamine 2-epimerase, partial [bacterium]